MATAVAVSGPAAAQSSPWGTDTVFVSESAQRDVHDGGLYAITPDGTATNLMPGWDIQDVAAASDGTLYFVACTGGLYRYRPGSGPPTLLRKGLICPRAIAIEPSGNLLVGDWSHLYEISPDGTVITQSTQVWPTASVAIDPAGDLYAIDGAGHLQVRLAGTAWFQQVSGVAHDGELRSVRIAADSSLVVADTDGAVVDLLSTPTDHGAGIDADGAAIDANGDLWISDLNNDPSTQDQVDFLPAGGSRSVLATGFDSPRGISVYPTVTTAARSASSVTVAVSAVGEQNQVTLTATVDGGAATSGLVQFALGHHSVGDAAAVNNGTASAVVTMPKGLRHITATYLGSAAQKPSRSAPLDYTGSPLPSTITLSAPSTTVPQASPVSVTATVSGPSDLTPVPTGFVRFYVHGESAAQASIDQFGRATARFPLPAGTPRVTGRYLGDQYYSGRSATLVFTTIAPYVSSTTGVVHLGSVYRNHHQHVTIGVTVTGVAGQPKPTGTTSASHPFVCTAVTPAAHARESKSSCTANLAPGFHEVTLSYSGDSTYAASHTTVHFSTTG